MLSASAALLLCLLTLRLHLCSSLSSFTALPFHYDNLSLPDGTSLSLLFGGAPLGSPDSAGIVVCLHGFPEGSWSWAGVFGSGSLDHYSLVAPDLRGYNRSTIFEGNVSAYNVENVAQDVYELLGALRSAPSVPKSIPLHLVAHDWGGAVAFFVATAYPEALSSLSIINMAHPMGWIAEVRNNTLQQQASAYVLSFVNPAFTAYAVANNYSLLKGIYEGENFWTPEEESAYVASWSVPGSVDGGLDYYRANIFPACPLSCTTASCWTQGVTSTFDAMSNDGVLPPSLPVRVLWGMLDTAFDNEGQLAYMATKVMGSLNVTKYAANGHWLAQEEPGSVALQLRDFFDANNVGVKMGQ